MTAAHDIDTRSVITPEEYELLTGEPWTGGRLYRTVTEVRAVVDCEPAEEGEVRRRVTEALRGAGFPDARVYVKPGMGRRGR